MMRLEGEESREARMTATTTQAVDTGQAVEHLSDYYRHLTTVGAGAIVVIATFAKGITSSTASGWVVIVALFALAICILASTLMMWAALHLQVNTSARR